MKNTKKYIQKLLNQFISNIAIIAIFFYVTLFTAISCQGPLLPVLDGPLPEIPGMMGVVEDNTTTMLMPEVPQSGELNPGGPREEEVEELLSQLLYTITLSNPYTTIERAISSINFDTVGKRFFADIVENYSIRFNISLQAPVGSNILLYAPINVSPNTVSVRAFANSVTPVSGDSQVFTVVVDMIQGRYYQRNLQLLQEEMEQLKENIISYIADYRVSDRTGTNTIQLSSGALDHLRRQLDIALNIDCNGYANASSFCGDGTNSMPYIITNVEQLQKAGDYLSNHYILSNNIDASNSF